MSLKFEQPKGCDFFFVYRCGVDGSKYDIATIRNNRINPYGGESFSKNEVFTIAHFITEQINGGEPQGCRK